MTQAKGISVLVREELHAAVGPLQRSVWELWIEWRYLLRVGDRRVNSAKVLLNAQIEALEFMDAHRDVFGDPYLQRLHRNVLDFESSHPEASAQIRQQRQRRRYHWSGLSRSAMERTVAGGLGVYNVLSWDAHSVVNTLRDVSIERREGTVVLQFGQTEESTRPDFTLYSTGGVLFYVYNDFAEMWGLQTIVVPERGA